MALVKISKGADIRHEYTDGVSRVPVLEGAYKDAAVERISLQPGAELSPALYSKTEHNQVFLITAGKGYIATPRRVFNITEVSVFVPDFDKEQFTFHCAADAKECMEIVHFVTAEDEKIHVEGGDITFTPHGSHHGSECAEGERFAYVWFELCENGYPGEIK